MKKRLLPAIISLTAAMSAAAQTEMPDSVAIARADSLARTLDELVVEGRTQRVIQNGVEYIPGKKMKKAAIDASTLLFNMQIPQLRVSPNSTEVSTLAGDGVSIFIDYVPATQQDAKALRPADVLRVEVLDYPQDPRFNGASHVVNFIMQQYEWGGYTTVSAAGSTLAGNDLNGQLYQKFVYKKLTIDASAHASINGNNKYRDYNKETFRDITYAGEHFDELTRISSTDESKTRSNVQMAALRASYRTKSSYLRHSLSFNRSGTTVMNTLQNVEFSSPILPSTTAVGKDPSQSISAAVVGYYQFTLPKGNSLSAEWSIHHSNNRQNSSYRLGDEQPILNGNREKTFFPNLMIYYSKSLGHNNTLRTMISSNYEIYHTDYFGSFTGLQKLISTQSQIYLEYMQSWGFGLSLYSRVGASYVYGRLNGTSTMHEWNPRFALDLQYRINTKNSLSISGYYANSAPQPSLANSALVRTNELLWSKGNPDLKNIYGPVISLSYTFVPRNNFSLSAVLKYEKQFHVPLYVYKPMEGIDGLVRTFSDRNNEQTINALIAASWRLLNNSLVLYARGEVKRELYTGIRPLRETFFQGFAQASYYLGNASIHLFYNTPGKRTAKMLGATRRFRCSYGVIATYAIGNFSARVDFSNWFSKGRYYTTYDFGQYSSSGWKYGSFDKYLSLTLSYTFTYGKKVSRDSDLRNEATKSSAILK